MTDKNPCVIYIQKDKFHIYSPHLPSVLEFKFTADIVRDMDVVNAEQLEKLIKTFIVNSKLPPSSLIFVIADNASFIKDFTMPNKQAQQQKPEQNVSEDYIVEQGEKFIAHAPFDNVVSKLFPIKNGVRVFLVNQDLYESVRSAFEKNGFVTQAIIPGIALGNNLSSRPALDQGIISAATQKVNSVKQFDLLSQPAYRPEIPENKDNVELDSDTPSKLDERKRLFILVGVLVVLVIIMIVAYLIVQPFAQPKKKVSTGIIPQIPVSATVAPTIIEAPQASASGSELKNLSVQITTPSSSTQQAQDLKDQLSKLGFKSINTRTQNSLGSTSTHITFSTNIGSTLRTSIIDEVKKISPNPTIQEKKDSQFDVSIILIQ